MFAIRPHRPPDLICSGHGLERLFLRLTSGLAALGFIASCTGQAVDWQRFRGPYGSGVVETHPLCAVLDSSTNLLWKTRVPQGCSSPIAATNRIWLAGYEGDRRLIQCLELGTGRRLWEESVQATRPERKSPPNDPASSTPVTDGLNVYVLFSGFGLLAFGPNGEKRWGVPLEPFSQPHGMSSSPILAAGKIIVLADQITNSYVAAFDVRNGKLQWKSVRPSFVGGYSTPVEWNEQLLVSGPLELVAYAAESGARLWSLPKMGVLPIGSPVLSDRQLFINNGAVPPFEALAKELKGDRNGDGKLSPDEFPDPSFKEAVLTIDRVYGNGDGMVDRTEWDGALKLMENLNTLVAVQLAGSHPKELWRTTKNLADVASPLVYENVLYLLKDGGLLSALDPRDGKILWRERVSEIGGRYFASPVAGDGKVYTVSETGEVSVIKAGPAFGRLSSSRLNEACYATPAIAGKCLLVRTVNTLWAFGN